MNRRKKSLSSLIDPLPRSLEDGEFRLDIRTEEFESYGSLVLEQVAKSIEKELDWSPELPNYEGIRVNCPGENEKGWFLLRMSLHDPVMPLNVESNVDGGVKAITRRLLKLLRTFEHLGLDELDGSLISRSRTRMQPHTWPGYFRAVPRPGCCVHC